MSENKKKKESIADLAKKAIKAKYAEEGKTLFHVSGTSLKGHGIGNFFAVFNPSGIEVYEFTTDKNLVLKHTLLWTDWSSVHIDHFALKSVFLFKGSGGEEQFAVSDGSGKQSEEVIRQHTQIEVSLHSRKWYQKILGFRSGKRWKMITASLVYLMLLFGIIGAFTGGGDAQQTVAEPSKQEESKPISKPGDKKANEKDAEDKEIEKEIRLAQERLKKEEEQKKKEEQMKKEKEQKESKKEEAAKKEPKKEKAPKKESLPIDKKIVKENSHIEKAKLNESGHLIITLDGDSSWSENTIVTTKTYWGFEAVKQAFDDPSVNTVGVEIEATLTDNKGNEEKEWVETFEYTREAFDELNYDKFLSMASGQEWRILNESSSYAIHPAIYNSIKDKYKENLIHGSVKAPGN